MNHNPFTRHDEMLIMTLCFEEESILLNRSVLECLGMPKQVQLLINEDQGMLLLKSCTVEDREALVVPQLLTEQFEVSGSSLLKRIRRITGWTDNYPRQILGTPIPEYSAITFNLQTAIRVHLKQSTM